MAPRADRPVMTVREQRPVTARPPVGSCLVPQRHTHNLRPILTGLVTAPAVTRKRRLERVLGAGHRTPGGSETCTTKGPCEVRQRARQACSRSREQDCSASPQRPARPTQPVQRRHGRRSRSTAGAAGTTGAIPVGYSCSLAAYGQDLAPLNIPAALSAESTGLTVTVKLVTQPVQLPAATASALPQLSYLDIAGTASANGMSGSRCEPVRPERLPGHDHRQHDTVARHDRKRFRHPDRPGPGRRGGPADPHADPGGLGFVGSASPGSALAGLASAGSAWARRPGGPAHLHHLVSDHGSGHRGDGYRDRRTGADVHVHGNGRLIHHDRQPGSDELDRDGTGHRRPAGHGDALRAREHARLRVSRHRLADVRVGRGWPGRHGMRAASR